MDRNHTDITGATGASLECMIGKTFRHNARAKYYIIKGVAYMGELDMWGLRYEERGAPPEVQHVRSHVNFFGKQAGSDEARFEEV